jgi:CheY-like chemotaxis protein
MKSAPVLANQPIDITIPALPAQPSLVTSSQLRLCGLPIHRTAAPLTLTIRVLIADDHPLVRQGLQAALAPLPEVEVVTEAATGQEAIREVVLHRPDVVVMDLQMPELNGIEATRELRPGTRGPGPAGYRPQQPPDRRTARPQRQDGYQPHLGHLRQAPGGRPHPGHPARPRRRPRPPLTSQEARPW